MAHDADMINHVERTRAQASHNYRPQHVDHDAAELAEWLQQTFGKGLRGIAASFGEATPPERPPLVLQGATLETPVKRGRGRPRKQ